MDKRVTLFWCNWSDVYDEIKEVKKSECDFVIVNPWRFSKTNDPFDLIDQSIRSILCWWHFQERLASSEEDPISWFL